MHQRTGTVVVALLNHRLELAALGDVAHQPPYKAPPSRPVLGIKPRNTHLKPGAVVAVPAGEAAVVIGATLGIVIGRTACRVSEGDAMACVAGYTVAADLSLPIDSHASHASHYRPAIRQRARDGFCPISDDVIARDRLADPDSLSVCIRIDGALAQQTSTAQRIRGVARLIADISDFMTLSPGDVLLLGAAAGSPRAGPGQSVSIEIDGLAPLRFTLIAEGNAA